jgi:DHA1 family bicyclomycin/chloramphenicol resistance-like MFS transporter
MRDRSGSGRWLIALLGVMTSVGAFAIDMYLPALPSIVDEFDAGAARVQLTLTACLVGIGLGQLLVGPLSDRWGRRRPALAGISGYVLASLVCAVAPTVEVLIAGRLLQGFTAGATTVIARAVVRDRFSGTEAAAYFSYLMLFFGIAPVIAPTVGGAVLRYTDWRGIFVVLAVVGALVTAAAVAGLPESLPPGRRHAGGLAGTVRGMRALLADREYVGYVAVIGFGMGAMFSYIAGSSFALQRVYGVSAQAYALVFGLNSLALVVSGQVNARLVRRIPTRRLLVGAVTVLAAAGVAEVVAVQWHSLIALVAPMLVLTAAVGMILPNTTALALDLHPERAGAASALLGFATSVSGAAVAPLVGLGGDRTAVPMAVAMAACALAALISLLTLTRAAPVVARVDQGRRDVDPRSNHVPDSKIDEERG